MLSSTVVTVLAPHWNGRPKRTKRPEVMGNLEGQGGLHDVTNTAANHSQGRFHEFLDRSLRDGSQAQSRVPFLGTRRNTVGWSTKSGPESLDYESKRKMLHTVSIDVNSGRMNSRNMYASPVHTAATPVSPLSFETSEQRTNPHPGHQGGLSSLSSKPTTSRMLLSLRRCNSNSRINNAASPTPEMNPLPLSSSPRHQDGKLFTTHLSQTFLNNNGQERSNPLLSPSGNAYRTETGPIISPSASNQRERNTFETRFFSTSPTSKGTEDTPFSQQAETMTSRTQSSLSCFQHPIPIREPTENCRGSDKSTNVFSGSYSPKHSPFDRSSLLNNHSLPRRTNLTSTSWWKQVSPECSSNQTANDTTNIKEKLNTPIVPPYNDNRDLASACPTDNKRCVSQIANNRDNNNGAESVFRGNMNLIMTNPGGTNNVKPRIAEDSPGHGSDRLVKQQYGSNLNNRDPQKPHSLPDVFPTSKISRATLNHSPEDLSRRDLNPTPFTANKTELPLTLLNPKSSNTPTESSSYSHCTSKTNSTPASSHNHDSQIFVQPPLSLATTNSFCIQAPSSTTISGLSQCPSTKPTSHIHSHAVASQTPIGASPYTCSSSQIPLITKITPNTPLRYERSIASVNKPFHPKTVSSPTVGAFSTNYSTASHHVAITAPRTSLLTSLNPGISSQSSLLTPPATPNIIISNDSAPSSLKEPRAFSNSPENDPKKKRRVEGKRVRRVTWEDSVDLKHSEPGAVNNAEPFHVPMSSSSLESSKVASIASFLRSRSSTTNTAHFGSPSSKTASIHRLKGEKYRSLSSDCADWSRDHQKSKQRPHDTRTFDQGMRDVTTPRQGRTLSVDSDSLQCRSSAHLSLPSDFSSYKLRYSSPPYTTLISTRPSQGETKTILSRSPLFQQPQSNYTPHLSRCTDSGAAMTMPTSKPPLSPTTRGSAKGGLSETDIVNNNHSKSNRQDSPNGQLVFVHNRLHEAHTPSSKCVTETLVYSVKSKEETATPAPRKSIPKPLQHDSNIKASVETELSQQSHRMQSKEAAREPHSHSDLSSSVSRSSSNGKAKENVLGKSRFFSMESNNEQSTKRSRFALKKSDSTPQSSLSRSQPETASKPSNKMDQVFSRLKQKFSTRLSDEDVFPWKWKRASQTSSVNGSGDVSDNAVESNQKLDEQEQEKGMLIKEDEKGRDCADRWKTNRYSLIPASVAGEELYSWSGQTTLKTERDEQTVYPEYMESQKRPHLTITSPTTELDFYKDKVTDSKPSNLLLYCSNHSPGRSPKTSADSPTQLNKSTSSPRSPFSPFPSLSPVSQMTSTDDNVFFSPKLQRHRESPSPGEPGEGISLGASRRTRASTGPPSASPGPDNERLASSYADLKYGIEPGRSFSVSSVLSSRPSGPGRISTGSRFMSVGDLSDSALTCGKPGKDLDQWSVNPDWTTDYDCQSSKDCRQACFPSDPGKMRSRSLPRSLTRRLANWSSEVFASQPATSTASKSPRLWSPNMNPSHFTWDTEGPPTPPPTPPLSPVSRRMSKPPRLSSPTFPSASGMAQQVDNLSPRGILPSRGYVSSLTTFDESSDSSSDTTTDDEYYLETGEEKETEL
ncbi:uncharacterized protein ACO6RY_13436 [Pungitius sinensis]